MITEELRKLADIYFQTQKLRIAVENRITAAEKKLNGEPMDPNTIIPLLEDYHTVLKDWEDRIIFEQMIPMVKEHPVWPWLKGIKGIGPVLSCKVLGLIGDIGRFDTISKLWRYSGLAVIDGKAERLTKGQKASFNNRLKSTMWLVSNSFLKSNSKYRKLYDEGRKKYKKREDWTDMRRHNAALRLMSKRFLAHLWLEWRAAEGLEIRLPYVHEKLGHTTMDDPWDYVEIDTAKQRVV